MFERYMNLLYRLCYSILLVREDAEDAVQDLYERLWRRRLFLRQEGFRSLVMTAIRNAALDRLRERERRRSASIDEVATEGVELEDRRDEVLIIKGIIERLPEREREVIHLRDVEGMAFEDIAEVVGCSEVAARMAHSRARQKVREEFSKIMNYGL